MASLSTLPVAKEVDYQDEATLERFIDAMAGAFLQVAISICFIIEIDKTPPPFPSPLINRDRMRQHISRIEGLAKEGAILLEAGDMSAVAVWEPPNFQGKPFSESENPGPLRKYFRNQIREYKEKYLGNGQTNSSSEIQLRPFYHLAFLARNQDKPSVPGAISAVMNPTLEKARNEGVPAWLEASGLQAVKVYEYFGFRLVGTIVAGKGEINADGFPESGGTGVTAYLMIYDNHLRE